VDQVAQGKPRSFTLGMGKLFPALEITLIGMRPGTNRSVTVDPEDAYGPHYKNLIHNVNRSSFGDRLDPKPGMILSLSVERDGKEEQVPATVISVNNESVTVDYNHPLAGKAINYTITLHAID
jgi:FKBP-type peptidyl-prolyl cis-trans isomerase 2